MPILRGVAFCLDASLLARGADPAGTLDNPTKAEGSDAFLARVFGRHRLGVLVASPRHDSATVWQVLAGLDWSSYFEGIATAADLGPDTPGDHPDAVSARSVRALASAMGIQIPQLAVVSSRRADLLAANTAGAWAVGLDVRDDDAVALDDLPRPDRPVGAAADFDRLLDVLATLGV